MSSALFGPSDAQRRTTDESVAWRQTAAVRMSILLRFATLAVVVLYIASIGSSAEAGESDAPTAHKFVVRSKQYTIDAIYRSMKGPEGIQALLLGNRYDKPELFSNELNDEVGLSLGKKLQVALGALKQTFAI